MAIDVDGERSKRLIPLAKKMLLRCRLTGLERMTQKIRGFAIAARTYPADKMRVRAPEGVVVLAVHPADRKLYGFSMDSLQAPSQGMREWQRCADRDAAGTCSQRIPVDLGDLLAGDRRYVSRPSLVAQGGEILQMLHSGGGRDRSGERSGLYRHNNPLYNYRVHCWSPHGPPQETPAATERDPDASADNVFPVPDVSTSAPVVFYGRGTCDVFARAGGPATDYDRAASLTIGLTEPVQSLIEGHRRVFEEDVDRPGVYRRTASFEFDEFYPRAAYTVERLWGAADAELYFNHASYDLFRAYAHAFVVPQTREQVEQGQPAEIRVLTVGYHTTPSLPTTDGPWLHPSAKVSWMSVTGSSINSIEYKTPLRWSSLPYTVDEGSWDGLYVPYPGWPLVDYISSRIHQLRGWPYANVLNKVTFYDPGVDDFITWGKPNAGSGDPVEETVGSYAFRENLTAYDESQTYPVLDAALQMADRGLGGYTFPAGAAEVGVRIEYTMGDDDWLLVLRKFPDGDVTSRSHVQSLHVGTPWGGWVDLPMPAGTAYQVDCVRLANAEAMVYALADDPEDGRLYIWELNGDPADQDLVWTRQPGAIVDLAEQIPAGDREACLWSISPFGGTIPDRRLSPGGCPPLSTVVESWQEP